MERAPWILLPPSKAKSPGGERGPWADEPHRHPELDGARHLVLAALGDALRSGAGPELLGVNGAALERATAADLAADTAPTRAAALRYTGVLYQTLDVDTLPGAARRRLGGRVRIFSGLWGVVSATDPIPDYRLDMSATLPGLGSLTAFWREHLTTALDAASAGRVVWDLRPNEHLGAWTPPPERTRIVVRFLDEVSRGGERRLVTVSHWNKLLKGALVRHLLIHDAHDDLDVLAGFGHDGFRWEPDRTRRDGATTTVEIVRRG